MSRIEQLQQFLSEDPGDVFLLYALALEYIKTSEIMKATELLESVISKNADYVAAYYQLGQLLEKTSVDNANDIYLRGIEAAIRTKNLHAKAELTTAYNSLNDIDG